MTKYALVVGLSSVNPAFYDGWDGKEGCAGSELDAENFSRLLTNCADYPKDNIMRLDSREATASNLLGALSIAAENCEPGDTFTFYYSGHHVRFTNQNQSLTCYDRELHDREIVSALEKFKTGVRIVMLTDSHDASVDATNNTAPLKLSVHSKSASQLNSMIIHLATAKNAHSSDNFYETGSPLIAKLVDTFKTAPQSYNALYNAINPHFNITYTEFGPTENHSFNQFRDSVPLSDIPTKKRKLDSGSNMWATFSAKVKERTYKADKDQMETGLPYYGGILH